MSQNHGKGWLPDVPRPSDYHLAHPEVIPLMRALMPAAAPPPPKVDLTQWFSPVEDQGKLDACAVNAAIALLEYFEKRAHGAFIHASRLFLYKAARNLAGYSGDTGVFLRTAMEALAMFGAPPERYWPYDGRPAAQNTTFDLEPSAFCYACGGNYKAITYFRLDPDGTAPATILANAKSMMATGFPCMFGFPAYQEFETPGSDGVVLFPAAGSKYYGGHAVVAAGYDDTMMIGGELGALQIRNSWGVSWGDNGCGWMPYRYVLDGYTDDWWSMTSADWIATGKFG